MLQRKVLYPTSSLLPFYDKTVCMKWIYLSPHLDDAILSCGGMIHAQTLSGDTVDIWSIFTGDPPPDPLFPIAERIHKDWEAGSNAYALRRAEDQRACPVVGAGWRHFEYQDCIYRTLPGTNEPLIQKDEELFQPIPPSQEGLVFELQKHLAELLPGGAAIVSPLTIGSHVDHHIVRKAAEQLGLPLLYYPDFPYVVTRKVDVSAWLGNGWKVGIHQPVNPLSLLAWGDAIQEYTSQVASFWRDDPSMRLELDTYLQTGGGTILWQPKPSS
jgi:LmbE family N-acetylglucosaminyl deacetylase